MEGEKKREYGERIREVEHGSFTPLVFTASGGMGQEAAVVVKKLADDLAMKRNESYSRVVCWMPSPPSFYIMLIIQPTLAVERKEEKRGGLQGAT